jgi:cytidine deaminase
MEMKMGYDELDEVQKKLVNEADAVVRFAFDPYSKFFVGAAVLTNGNNIYKGVNVNTCSYGSICAERSAICQAVASGEYSFRKIAVIAKSQGSEVRVLSGPCGICRQMIWEFSDLVNVDIEIIMVDSKKEHVIVTSIKKLHPYGFGPRLCGGDYGKYLKKPTG